MAKVAKKCPNNSEENILNAKQMGVLGQKWQISDKIELSNIKRAIANMYLFVLIFFLMFWYYI